MRLLFEEKSHALDFLVELSRLRSEHHRFRDLIEFEGEPVEVSVPEKATLIYFQQYDTTDSTSPPCLSLADLLTEYSKLTTIVYDPHDPHIGLCSFENFSFLAPQQRLYKCHIASKSDYPKYAKDMDNNIIYASQDFHNYFDGMQTESGDPELAVQYIGNGGVFSMLVDRDGTHDNRCKVLVRIIFRDEEIAEFMKLRLRDYSEEKPLSLNSYFFVKDVEIAKDVLTIKYNDTMAKWGVHGVDSDEE